MTEIKTKDTEEASYLWTLPFVLFEDVECKKRGTSGITVFFRFTFEKEQQEVNDIRKAYFNRKASVEPKAFSQRQSDVRDILHSALRQYKNK